MFEVVTVIGGVTMWWRAYDTITAKRNRRINTAPIGWVFELQKKTITF